MCEAFVAALARYGVSSEVLTDNGKQFTGRFAKPYPAEVLFERICRENGITTRLTKPRSPTTTGNIERWHKTLRRELLDAAGPFPSVESAQAAIDAWVQGYNHSRPHQSLDMDIPVALFRPAPLEPVPAVAALQGPLTAMVTDVVVPPWKPMVLPAPAAGSAGSDIRAVEWETTLTGRARLLLPGDQQLKFTAALAHRQVTVWASDRSIHVVLDGAVIRTRPSRLSEHDLRNLVLRGLGRADGFRARRRLRADSVLGPRSLRRSRSRRTDRRGWTAVSAVRG
ncbi:MAG: hypothetical protein QOC69_2909 [Mycobacterium sp.]|nr:hypothetical protein [Mycobacterium sp.]